MLEYKLIIMSWRKKDNHKKRERNSQRDIKEKIFIYIIKLQRQKDGKRKSEKTEKETRNL